MSRLLAGCPNGNCERVIESGAETVEVQGETIRASDVPDGESRVTLSKRVFLEAAGALRDSA